MVGNARLAFCALAGCAFILGAIASCSNEPPPDEVRETSAPLAPGGQQGGAVTPPAVLRKIAAPACVAGDCASEFAPPFTIQEIGQSDTHLYVGFKYRGPEELGVTAPSAELVATVNVEGCDVGRPAARGGVRQAKDGVSWVEVPLSELPDGEFELTLRGRVGDATAFGSLSLHKAGGAVRHLPTSERKGYSREVVVDPSGTTFATATVDAPKVRCAQ